ncbi:MAG: hypothetical protein KAX38_05750, partial [Candidatus Krumholzibacteria bacterium]|nr:hypothetical protein [Candidatus Krumholzibacteria bacterium]
RFLMLALSIPFVLTLAVTPLAAQAAESKTGAHDHKEKCKDACEGKCPSYCFKFSGFFKGDLIYDDARVTAGNYAILVPNKARNDVMNITARETRLGLNFFWKENDIRTEAKLEFDFYGLGAQPASYNSMENKAAPMLRHAFLKVTKGRFSILAGQTSDVISPLVPKTVNYTVCWGQGNIGYRRPQFRVSVWVPLGENAKVRAAVAVARSLGSDLDGDGIDDGSDAACPSVQGRLGLDAAFGESGSAAIGFSGHYGREEYLASWGFIEDTESWSFNVDLNFSPCNRVDLSGEFFVGKNLGTYFGGVMQSVNPHTPREISAMGGWGMVSVIPKDRLTLNLGYSWDDPDEDDFALPIGIMDHFINMNSAIFGNWMYSVTSNVTAMLEVSYLKTTYIYMSSVLGRFVHSEKDYDAMRVQFAIKAAIK